jgi:S-adenosylmethionine-dependent methyltransferase
MVTNFWFSAGASLRQAFLIEAKSPKRSIQYECLGRSVTFHFVRPKLEILDIGGGDGGLALWFARSGHRVVVLDPDTGMLAAAKIALSQEDPQVRARVSLIRGFGESAWDVLQREFDVVLCHSVISYLGKIDTLFSQIKALSTSSSILSVLSPNPASCAMRSGLARDWLRAIGCLRGGADPQVNGPYAPDREWTVQEVISLGESVGFELLERRGFGVFTDHLPAYDVLDDLGAACEAEWLAGGVGPYKDVARCFHLIFRKRDAL